MNFQLSCVIALLKYSPDLVRTFSLFMNILRVISGLPV